MSSFKTDELEGKPFNLGTQDCFTLVQDFFLLNFGIKMPNIARPNDWKADDDNLIDKWYHLTGFEKLDVDEEWPPRPADVMVCTVGGSVPNHLVIYLGGNQIIHHKDQMLSGKELMRPAWKRYTSYLLRHPDVPDLREKKPTMDLLEVYREKLV